MACFYGLKLYLLANPKLLSVVLSTLESIMEMRALRIVNV